MGRTWNKPNSEVIDQQLLDRLVDGELSDDEERALIARLEETPDGWRYCALAFLESRCWQRVAGAVTETCHEHPPVAQQGRTAAATNLAPWTWGLFVAATFLIALGLGSYLPGRRDHARTVKPSDALPSTGRELADVRTRADQPVPLDQDPASDLYLGDLRFVNDSGKEIEVPVYDWNPQMAEELMYRSQPLPAELVRQLKRHQVRSSRSFLPVRLKDGRDVVLPVQEVDITPVGRMKDITY